jgi:hypothetical protein
MWETPTKRNYVRTDSWAVTATVSKDAIAQCKNVPVPDIAAGGLLFLSDIPFEQGDLLQFDLHIDPMAPGISRKIRIKTNGEITGDRGTRDGMHAFSVKFTDISKGDRIRIDELIRMTNYKYKIDSGLDNFDV